MKFFGTLLGYMKFFIFEFFAYFSHINWPICQDFHGFTLYFCRLFGLVRVGAFSFQSRKWNLFSVAFIAWVQSWCLMCYKWNFLIISFIAWVQSWCLIYVLIGWILVPNEYNLGANWPWHPLGKWQRLKLNFPKLCITYNGYSWHKVFLI